MFWNLNYLLEAYCNTPRKLTVRDVKITASVSKRRNSKWTMEYLCLDAAL